MSKKPRKKLPRVVLGIIAAILLVLLFAEITVRLVRPQTTFANLREEPQFHKRSSYLPLELWPGAEIVQQSSRYRAVYRINPDGFRDPHRYTPTPGPGVTRYLALGDSFTFGSEVAEEDVWPKVLERMLLSEKPGSVEVINVGMAFGYSPDAYALYYRRRGHQRRPHGVIIGFFTGNDVGDMLSNDWIDAYPDGLPRQIFTRRTYYKDFEGRRLRTKHYPLRFRIPVLRNAHLFQLFAASPGGVKMGLVDEPDEPETIPVDGWERLRISLSALKEDTQRDSVELMLMLIPSKRDVGVRRPASTEEYHARLIELFDDLSIAYVDLIPQLEKWIQDGHGDIDDLYYSHFAPPGQKLAAEVLASRLKKQD